MNRADLIFGSPGWLWPAIALAASALAMLFWSYRRPPGSPGLRGLAALLKAAGVVLLLLCLVEPLLSGRRPRPGANLFAVVADDSQSMQIRDAGADRARSDQLQERFAPTATWHARLARDFDVRRYRFAERVESLDQQEGKQLTAGGSASSLIGALKTIARRFENQPLAGLLVFTDGNATDAPDGPIDLAGVPPIYPVQIGRLQPAPDVSVGQVAVTQTNFEQAPVTIKAEVSAPGYEGQKLIVQLFDAEGKQVDETPLEMAGEPPRIVRFQVRPKEAGTCFYQVRASAASELGQFESPARSREATLANNAKWVAVDRPAGPYRVLYVSGRPNWEFKFLRRALQEDSEVELVGLVRIARREPKFSFLSRAGESTNPLYRGFEDQNAEDAEQYDEPVLVRLGTRDEAELRGGFPKTADELYSYHAMVLDDVEAAFFTQEQMLLVQKFVSTRGGGLLMLGGAESFFQGEYARTPIGEMLPVYLDRQPPPAETGYRLLLSREGWLQPWVRLRETEEAERRRLDAMPAFHVVNRASGLKPGAAVLASVTSDDGKAHPALAAQRFGKGQVAALLIGDLWRWTLRRAEGADDDLPKAWRQTIRWLVSDVPGRISLTARRESDRPGSPAAIAIEVRGPEYEPMDNASVAVAVWPPGGDRFELRTEPSDETAGLYRASFLPRQPGPYRIRATVSAADGSQIGLKETGWTAEPAAEEFRHLTPNRELLREIARQTGGEVLAPDDLERFVAGLPNRKIPITEPWVRPLWQTPLLFLLAAACLIGEWGLRRWKGLP